MRNLDQLDTLSAIWILASNDDRPEISYAGLRHRLRLDGDIDERQLVAARGELFRLTIPEPRLADLKALYRTGKHLPSWLRDVPEGSEREQVIDRLTSGDFFRSQFRSERDAPVSPINIVDWGLQHIERLRRGALEASEAPIKRWSSVWIPLISTLIAMIAVGSSLYVQRQASIDQRALKEYEVSFRPKTDGYTKFLQAISTAFDRVTMPGRIQLPAALNEVQLAAIQLEPFLRPNVRDKAKDSTLHFMEFCLRPRPNVQSPSDSDIDEFLRFRDEFRDTLFSALFQ